MKKLIPILFIALAISIFKAGATPTLLIGSLVTVSNTTATVSSLPAFTYNQTLQQFSVTHSALTNLTSLRLDIYSNVQGSSTNGRVLIGTWYPTTTNAATETFSGSSYAITNYISVDIVTTNAVQIGGSYGN